METIEHMSMEDYVQYADWTPDAEYVDGVIEERHGGRLVHSMWQAAICMWFGQRADKWKIRVLPSLRIMVSNTRIRVPDAAILDAANLVEQIPTLPPLAVFEILSSEDTVMRLKRKLADYASMGISQIWVIDPADGQTQRYVD